MTSDREDYAEGPGDDFPGDVFEVACWLLVVLVCFAVAR